MTPPILVTGASGYVGQHLVASLLKDGIEVRGFSRNFQAPQLAGVEWQQGDVTRLADVEQAVQDCTAVVHLACSSLAQSWQDPPVDFQTNALGTFNVLHAARAAGVQRVVYTSTAQVYGSIERLPMAEDGPTQALSPYAASKLCGETLCAAFARCYGLRAVVLRLFNVYGLPLDGNERPTVETIFLKRISQGLPPVIKGRPDEARDFIHVSDVVRAIRLALAMEAMGQVINIGSGVMTTLLELAWLAVKVSGAALEPVVEKTEVEPLRLQADLGRARQVLGFQPNIPLAEGLLQLWQGLSWPKFSAALRD